ncbi:hypothetical protein RMP56_001768 [Campylobacter jejuni]|uniref:hypothetical protein n=1 Tax=Campylobacter jejuni TaxID=197 RepID=UPI00126FCED0|nr:hypothetical protein [Campylobacter jejuni]EAI9739304.1 hypothetical protein [Campylobacter jejuni]EAJ8970874.1 hypothetical protein [Campylobacter jejuni]EAK2198154.1 hypothetical protein [Campylobacter jejuni]ECP8663287.1 hypothetical protein [Campylobacter jejuni]ECP9001736.1 hypothetical protein [Campylobacter jejuni]
MSYKKDVFKEQYLLKRNIFYFFASKNNIYFFFISLIYSYIFSDGFESFILIYSIGCLFLYRFFFNIKKDDNPFKKIFLLIFWDKLIKKLRNKN